MTARSFHAKRKKRPTSCNPSRSFSHKGVLKSLRQILGRQAKIFYFPNFVRYYVPTLEIRKQLPRQHTSNEYERLLKTIINPLETLPLKPTDASREKKKPDCRESMSSLVDGVVSSLLRRRERLKRQRLDARNVLIQGYFPASEHSSLSAQLSSNMTPFVCHYPNDNVSFCKSSSFFQFLHSYVGDDLIRTILLHTRLFVPHLEGGTSTTSMQFQGTYHLICGSPLTFTSNNNKRGPSSMSTSRPRKKRKRDSPNLSTSMEPNSAISRRLVFYSGSYIPHVGLPSKHMLNDPACTATRLLASIVDLYGNKGVKNRKRWQRLRQSGVAICEKVQKGHAKCDYHRLLQRSCPLPDFVTMRTFGPKLPNGNPLKSDEKVSLPQLVKAFTSTDQVMSFLSAALRRVFPVEFWGSEHNFIRILETVKLFVNLRRKEKLPNKALLHGVRISKLSWLQGEKTTKSLSRTDHEATSRLALKTLRWLFRCFVIPLIRTNFHATETEFASRRVLFYRKPVWSMFRSLSMQELLDKQFTEISPAEAAKRSLSHHLGFSQLRLLPKSSGVRPIAHLSTPNPQDTILSQHYKRMNPSSLAQKSQDDIEFIDDIDPNDGPLLKRRRRCQAHTKSNPVTFEYSPAPRSSLMSTNAILRDLFAVLSSECRKRPTLYGAGLPRLGDFHPRYRRFIAAVRRKFGVTSSRTIIFGKVDIRKCFDNIKHDYLLEITQQLFSEQDYVIQQVKHMRATGENGSIVERNEQLVWQPESCRPIYATQVAFEGQSMGSVSVDTIRCQLAKRVHIVELLKEHVQDHVLTFPARYGHRYLLQTNGISQGSILSTLLCNLYYGSVEKCIFGEKHCLAHWAEDVEKTRTNGIFLLARMVDDFLFVTTDETELVTFLKKMSTGRPDLGATINEAKTVLSTSLNMVDARSSIGCDQSNGMSRLFPWCGMLFDTVTGEVLLDYSRFANGRCGDSLTVDRTGAEGRQLQCRMHSFVNPRCQPILFDSQINGLKVVVTNYYQMMLYGAVKTAAYLRDRYVGVWVNLNAKYLLRCISSLSSMAQRLIQVELKKSSSRSLCLSERTATWLCWQAFDDTFSRLGDFEELSSHISLELAEKVQQPSLRATAASALRQFHDLGLMPF